MREHSAVSPATALREVRRRKILENSANRLQLIENINSSPAKISSQTFVDPGPEYEVRKTSTFNNEISSPNIKSKLSEMLKTNKELKEISDFLLRDKNNVQEDEAEEEEVDISPIDSKEKNAFLKIFYQKKLHYVLLALGVNILLYFNVAFLFHENIFFPFYSIKAIELISARGKRENFQPMVVLFIAGLPKRAQKITKIILNLFLTILSDLCLYLFIFIIGTKIINSNQL